VLTIASMMICEQPRKRLGRLILSAYDGVWEAVRMLPEELRHYVTDDLGNVDVEYGGFLQVRDPAIFAQLEALNLFACFRLVDPALIDFLKVEPPVDIYREIQPQLKPVGWDIFCSDGWMSASTNGLFPIDPFTGAVDDLATINRFGLIESKEACAVLCKANDDAVPSWAPWKRVCVGLDASSYLRLSEFLT